MTFSLLVAACAQVGPPPTTAAETATTVSPTSTSAPCVLSPIISETADIFTALDADYDGDDAADTLSTYLTPLGWTLRLELTGGTGSEVLISDADLLAFAVPLGGFDLDDDGTPEAFVTVGTGATTTLVGLYRVDGCALQRVSIGGAPAVFPIGASVGNVSGLSCDGAGDLDQLFASSSDGITYEGGNEPFELDGSTLVAGPGDSATFTAEEAGALATIDCGSLTLP